MKIKTSELCWDALDWAAAKASNRVMREPIRATNDDLAGLKTPFTLHEVTTRRSSDGRVISAEVMPITVTRFGIAHHHGATAPSIDFTGADGRRGLGSANLFYLDRDEAELERLGAVNGYAEGFSPTSNGSQALQLLLQERIDIRHRPAPWCDVEATSRLGTPLNEFGADAVEAGLRCFVASRLGPEVDVPDDVVAASMRSRKSKERLASGSNTRGDLAARVASPAAAASEDQAETDWASICNEQGWDDASQIIHLEGFLRDRGLFAEFATYAAASAREENMDDSDGQSAPSCAP